MYSVTKRFGRTETRIKDFPKEADAMIFIKEKLLEDIRFKIMASYCLYEGADLLREFTQQEVETGETGDSSGSGSQQRGTGQSFAPTPFATTPRIGPQSFVRDNKEDDKKDEK